MVTIGAVQARRRTTHVYDLGAVATRVAREACANVVVVARVCAEAIYARTAIAWCHSSLTIGPGVAGLADARVATGAVGANALHARVALTRIHLMVTGGPCEAGRTQAHELAGAHGRALAAVHARSDTARVHHILTNVARVAGHACAGVARGRVGVLAQATILTRIGCLTHADHRLTIGARVAEGTHALDVGRRELQTRAAIVARHRITLGYVLLAVEACPAGATQAHGRGNSRVVLNEA